MAMNTPCFYCAAVHSIQRETKETTKIELQEIGITIYPQILHTALTQYQVRAFALTRKGKSVSPLPSSSCPVSVYFLLLF